MMADLVNKPENRSYSEICNQSINSSDLDPNVSPKIKKFFTDGREHFEIRVMQNSSQVQFSNSGETFHLLDTKHFIN